MQSLRGRDQPVSNQVSPHTARYLATTVNKPVTFVFCADCDRLTQKNTLILITKLLNFVVNMLYSPITIYSISI